MTCWACEGKGLIVGASCADCDGRGHSPFYADLALVFERLAWDYRAWRHRRWSDESETTGEPNAR